MDADVAQLVREERLLEAARLASERGDARGASAIYERACDWRHAAAEAIRAGDAARALELALRSGDDATAEGALATLIQDARAALACAARLAGRGEHAWAAKLLERCGRELDAARAWERAGEARRAAALFDHLGIVAETERVLQAALRREPSDWGVAVRLGALLGRLGKWEAAARVLQRVPPAASERRDALIPLAHALAQLGLPHAAAEVVTELDSIAKRAPKLPAAQEPAVSHRARLFGRYELVREVASSPGARVLDCVDALRGERVAVKLFVGCDVNGSGHDALARFENDIRAVQSINHPNIVPLRDFIRDVPAIVSAWMGGGTLERLLSGPARISPARAVEIARAVLSALGAAHRLGILHRDVKPANVLLDEVGGAHLSDFGATHLADASTTATAAIFDTLAYKSPERREGRPATVGDDLFAAGVILRDMLTAERSSAGAAPLLPSEAHGMLDARHDDAVARMTARDAHDRPHDAFEASAVLAALPWPNTLGAMRQPPHATHASGDGPSMDRLELRPDGTSFDIWAGRLIEQVPLNGETLARARAVAQADRGELQSVLRVDIAAATIWMTLYR